MINKIQIKISFGANCLDIFVNWTLASFACLNQSRTALSFFRRNENKKKVKDYYEGLITTVYHVLSLSPILFPR